MSKKDPWLENWRRKRAGSHRNFTESRADAIELDLPKRRVSADYSKYAEDFLLRLFSEKYHSRVLAWLAAYPDLSQPLPHLYLVGRWGNDLEAFIQGLSRMHSPMTYTNTRELFGKPHYFFSGSPLCVNRRVPHYGSAKKWLSLSESSVHNIRGHRSVSPNRSVKVNGHLRLISILGDISPTIATLRLSRKEFFERNLVVYSRDTPSFVNDRFLQALGRNDVLARYVVWLHDQVASENSK